MTTDRPSPTAAARRLFDQAIVIDGLDTSAFGSAQVFRELRDGGVTALNATSAIWEGFADTLDNITRWLEWFREYDAYIRPVRCVADIHAAKAEGRAGIILGWQNTTPVENDVRRFALFHALGVRVAQLTYNERNLFGNGCWERRDDGLSHIGLAAVRELNRLGILIDLSHVGDRTVLDTIEHSEQPVAFTHANARSQIDYPRNKTDEAIRALVANGGVVGANAFPNHHPDHYDSTLDQYVDAVDYLVQMVGPDHVAIGTDFCMGRTREWFAWIGSSHGFEPLLQAGNVPQPYRHLRGFAGPLEFVNVADALLRRGYSDDDAHKILGGNWLRLFGKVWRED